MADVILPWNIPPTSIEWRIIDSTSVFRSPYSGAVRTLERSGSRLGCTVNWQNLNREKRRALIALAAQLKGRTNRVRIFDDSSVRAGVMAAPELVANNAFGNGVASWSAFGGTVTASNGVLRFRPDGSVAGPGAFQGLTYPLYQPLAVRSIVGNVTPGVTSVGPYIDDGIQVRSAYAAAPAYNALSFTPAGASGNFFPGVLVTNPFLVREQVDVPWCSVSRCALLDGGGNLLQQSDTFGTTWSVTNANIASNSTVAPDGTTTADGVQETAVNAIHLVAQNIAVTSSAQDVAFMVAVKAGTRGFACLEMSEGTGTTSLYLNLTTGAITNLFNGTNWSGVRGFAASLGNGWWLVSIVARKTSVSTTIGCRIYPSTAAGTISYLGVVGSDAIKLWRGTAAASSHPTRLTSSVAAVVSPASQSGTGLYLKGLPPSTNGLLEAGDRVEINGQMVIVTAALDSDGAGLGYLQCFPPLRTPSASDTPVIFNAPTMRGVLVPEEVSWQTQPGGFSDFSLQFEEAF